MVYHLSNTYRHIAICKKNNQYTLSRQELRKLKLQENSVLTSLKQIVSYAWVCTDRLGRPEMNN